MRAIAFFFVLLWAMIVVTFRRLMRGPVHPLFSWTQELLAHVLRQGLQRGLQMPLAQARARLPASPIPEPLQHALTLDKRVQLGGRPAEVTTPRGWCEGDPELLYLHGGGYVACSPGTHRELVARIAVASGARCHSLDYRLAPEHPFPSALEDALAAYRELLGRGIPSDRLLIGGDSAGGGLSVATLLSLRQEGEPLPAGAVLLSPWVDLNGAEGYEGENLNYCYLVPEALELYADCYLQERDADDPLASPVHADLSGLPPLLVQTGSAEGIHTQILTLARRAEDAGVEVTLQVGEGMFHAWQAFARFLPEARSAIDGVGEFVRARVRRPESLEPPPS
jgi:epsilon-lactone hydrolase